MWSFAIDSNDVMYTVIHTEFLSCDSGSGWLVLSGSLTSLVN